MAKEVVAKGAGSMEKDAVLKNMQCCIIVYINYEGWNVDHCCGNDAHAALNAQCTCAVQYEYIRKN